jgi:hypothetical protein
MVPCPRRFITLLITSLFAPLRAGRPRNSSGGLALRRAHRTVTSAKAQLAAVFFSNATLELLWLENEEEARSEQTRATKLWERFSAAGLTASPFGIILRPAPGSEPACPWRSWNYRPQAMPGLELEIAADTESEEPMWCYMKSGRAPAEWPRERLQPLDHPVGFREITGVVISCPCAKEGSVTAAMASTGVIALHTGMGHLLELQFDGERRGTTLDFRPALPLIFRV